MAKRTRDIGASVRSRLLKLARDRGQPFDLVITRYALERLLHRLSQSPHRDRFALKGAMLITTWFADPHRPTRDLDLLGFGDSSEESILDVFREVCGMLADDGITFEVDNLRIERIREELEYGGLRLRTIANLSRARINVVIDVGFGDAVEPGLEEIEFPVLLDSAAPRLRAYPRETVIAEKFQAMVYLGRANSRMKDFYDVWVLSKAYEFDEARLAKAIAATFERRRTAIPNEVPDALTPEFARDASKRRQWESFVRELAAGSGSLETVVSDLAAFLMPMALKARASTRN
ncbi:MAG: nucleotidyl transferase AbiEii/AbiGii toxin family protein [Candidatus Binatus sp.]|uniref:nucleotidyl transferase AbiEii/AbiGii toxin family protein n=1 Tax=Candidatus Binatus sp. TaxID=2811406 RepID=UPI002728DB53|nr:nucleotidyl transferase AbiEii/AbiGii toxin family protein [Candidatus Binatus sp.]MDO8432073.1 nucleotidyl transferase AbiEii/AbiGii toxin family protein [Candidatus Binatus sp.]